jgi:dihydrofolate synthase / folylpolyglutamate synthase
MGNVPSYQQTLNYLYEKLPMFSRIGKAALKPDLTNTIKLCTALGNPQEQFKSVHIAGTNGKGSTSHALAAVMQQAGYKTGLYTSPHLVDFRERIRINGKTVTEEWVINFVTQHKALIEEIQPSFFEITVAMAFAAFAEEQVDIAIIETGLGGRLDSTNIITPLLSIITNISYDHKDLLGNTLPEIAAEKAGIIKPHVPVVIGEQNDETERVFFEHSVHKQSTLYYAESLWGMVRVNQDSKYQYFKAINNATLEMFDLHTDLLGNYQQHNIKTVLTAAELLSRQGYHLSVPNTLAALADVKGTTGLHGRWEWLQERPAIICDVAHNPAGLKEVLDQFENLQIPYSPSPAEASAKEGIPNPQPPIPNSQFPIPNPKKHIVLGFVKDKDVSEALSLFPKEAIYYFCNAQIERALPAAELKNIAEKSGLKGHAYNSVSDAVTAATNALSSDDALLITGSFFIVGEALSYRNWGLLGIGNQG